MSGANITHRVRMILGYSHMRPKEMAKARNADKQAELRKAQTYWCTFFVEIKECVYFTADYFL